MAGIMKRARQIYRSLDAWVQRPESLVISWVVCITILTIFESQFDAVRCPCPWKVIIKQSTSAACLGRLAI